MRIASPFFAIERQASAQSAFGLPWPTCFEAKDSCHTWPHAVEFPSVFFTPQGCQRSTPPAAHSASNMAIRSSAERSQKSWPLCFRGRQCRVFLTKATKSAGVNRDRADLAKRGFSLREVGRRDVHVGEIGTATARDADFSATLFAVVQHQNLQTQLACHAGTKQAGRTGTHDHNIKTLHGLQCIISTMTVPDTEALHNERDKTMNPIVYAIPVFMLTILLGPGWPGGAVWRSTTFPTPSPAPAPWPVEPR